MKLVLHSYRRCPFAIRVRMTLEEKGVPYSVVEESLRAPSAALLAVNPSGKVPVLIVDGVAMPESAVITAWLESTYPVPSLGSPGSWTSWCDDVFKPDLDLFKYKFGELTSAAQGELLLRLRACLGKLESALAGGFLSGDTLSMADIHVFPFYRQLTKSEGFEKHFGPVHPWLERIMARPSFERVMKKS